MVLVSEPMRGRVLEVGQTGRDAFEAVVEFESGETVRVPCTLAAAQQVAVLLYEPLSLTLTVIGRASSQREDGGGREP